MSDRMRKGTGILLMILTIALLAAGIFPLKQTEPQAYSSRGDGKASADPIPHLTEDSVPNTGNTEALTALPGIGPSIAEAVIREREENGNFIYPEDLTVVNGIGEKKLEQIKPLLATDGRESED